jgi:hypothetical protein
VVVVVVMAAHGEWSAVINTHPAFGTVTPVGRQVVSPNLRQPLELQLGT